MTTAVMPAVQVQPVLGLTGHRPDRWPHGYAGPDTPEHRRLRLQVREFACWVLTTVRPAFVISGMAQGFDQWFVEACVVLRVPFIAAIPFNGQESRWPRTAQRHYLSLLQRAQSVVCVGGTEGSVRDRMFRRDEWIVDNSHAMICAWDGDDRGGTAHTVRYAARKHKPRYIVSPAEVFAGDWQGKPILT